MPFKIFGKINYTPYTKVEHFAEWLKNGVLKGTKCKKCLRFYFPPRADCSECMVSEMEWVDCSGRCKLLTYTTVHTPPAGFENDAPYTIGVVELEEGGKALARIVDLKEEELKIGMELKLVPEILEEEELKVVYTLKKG